MTTKPHNSRSRYDENARRNTQLQQESIGRKNEDYFRRTGHRLVSSSLKPSEKPHLAINISSKPLIYKQDGSGVEAHRLAASTESGLEEMRQSITC